MGRRLISVQFQEEGRRMKNLSTVAEKLLPILIRMVSVLLCTFCVQDLLLVDTFCTAMVLGFSLGCFPGVAAMVLGFSYNIQGM